MPEKKKKNGSEKISYISPKDVLLHISFKYWQDQLKNLWKKYWQKMLKKCSMLPKLLTKIEIPHIGTKEIK